MRWLKFKISLHSATFETPLKVIDEAPFHQSMKLANLFDQMIECNAWRLSTPPNRSWISKNQSDSTTTSLFIFFNGQINCIRIIVGNIVVDAYDDEPCDSFIFSVSLSRHLSRVIQLLGWKKELYWASRLQWKRHSNDSFTLTVTSIS